MRPRLRPNSVPQLSSAPKNLRMVENAVDKVIFITIHFMKPVLSRIIKIKIEYIFRKHL